MGNIARQATAHLIERAAGGDPVWEEALVLRTNAVRDDLLGPTWTILEEAIVRRVVNGWLTVHHLELELAVRPPADLRAREHLDRAVSRAQKRMTSAVVELARVRRLQAPALLARLQVVADNPPESARPADAARR
jgi:hypothetical protein